MIEGHADRDDAGLTGVQQSEAGFGLDGGPLVAGQRAVEPRHFVGLVAERLDHLVVDQAVDRLAAELVVAQVHLAAELRAPVGGEDGERGVGDDRREVMRGERHG